MKLNPNVAESEVVDIQSVTTRIKEIVLQDVAQGVDKKVTELKIQKIIASVGFQDEQLTLTTRKTLRNFARTIYWQHSIAMRKTYKQFERDMKQVEPSYRLDPTLGFNPLLEIDRYRNLVDDASKGLPVIERYQQRVRTEIERIAVEAPIAKTRKLDGTYKEVSLRNLAEMRVRYEANNQDLKTYTEQGIDLVYTSSHADSSIRCQPYQGKLYSISGNSGTIDGQEYTPLDTALLGPDGDGNGIINGYNCRHRLIPYQRGLKPPTDYDSRTIKRERQIDQRQRYLENQIRNLKMKEDANRVIGDKDRASELNDRWKQVERTYQQYSLRNGRAFYRWRYQISRNEI
jgi:uncharacterized phage-associated protein